MIKDKPIYVCEYHEMAFYYWCKAKKEMNIEKLFLVTIDKHKDLMTWGLQSEVRNEISQLDLNDLVKIRKLAACARPRNNLTYRQSRAAMEAGVVGDVLIVSPEVPCEEIYEDLSKQKHRIFHCIHPNNLQDLLINNRSMKESIDYPDGNFNIILDIDLDFFTYLDDQDVPHVISEENFKNIFSDNSLIWWIYEKARLITISKEPFWCGEIDNSEHVFKLLKTYFLNRTNK